jgi:hypothetical protein
MESRFGLLGQVYNFITGLATVKRVDQDRNYYAEVLSTDLMPTAPNYRLRQFSHLNKTGYIDEVLELTSTPGEGLGASFIVEMDTPTTFTITFPSFSSAVEVLSSSISIMFDEFDVNGDNYYAYWAAPPPGGGTGRLKLGGETIFDGDFHNTFPKSGGFANSLTGGTMEFEITLSGFPAALKVMWVMFRTTYDIPPVGGRAPEWNFYYYGLDNIAYVAEMTPLTDGVPDNTVMTLDTSSRNALIKPLPSSAVQFYYFDYLSTFPYEGRVVATDAVVESDVILTGKYKRVEMRIRLIKPSSIGKSDFDGTREWFGQFKWRTATKAAAGESGCSISIPEPDFFRLSGGGDDWFILTWDSDDADTAGAWEDNGDILGWRILMYKYYPTSGVQQSDCFELDYIRFLEV